MREVIINIKDISTVIRQEYIIEIYCNNKQIIKDTTCDKYKFIADKKNIYVIKVISKKGIKIGVIKNNNELNIIFGNFNCQNNRVIINLFDYYYKELKIEKGVINLWPTLTQ